MLTRDDFATAVLIQLAEAGETRAVYDAASFSIVRQPADTGGNVPAGHCKLDRWYEKFIAAESLGRGDEVIADFVEQWQAMPQELGAPINKARLVPLVRSRFDYEAEALRYALQANDQGDPRDLMRLFSFPPLGEHLVTVLAEDQPEGYRQLSRPDRDGLGLTEDAALHLALFNLPQIDSRFQSPQSFGQRPGGYWLPAGEANELQSSWLLFPERVRTMPVNGRHVVFVPKVNLIAFTGTDDVAVLKQLVAMTFDALDRHAGRNICPIPFVLDAGVWKPWLPPTSHPAYWQIKELHVAHWSDIYDVQKQLLDKLNEVGDNENPPMIATYGITDHESGNDSAMYATQCVWTQSLDTLLPRSDAVRLTQLLNLEELERNESAEPQFGETLTIAWQTFADFLGPKLKLLDFYPPRWQVAGGDFPTGDDWQRLQAHAVRLPLEVMGGRPVRPETNDSQDVAVTALPVGTTMSQPLPPPPEFKPPPDPSWWPVAGCGLVCVLSLGCCMGGVLFGLNWVQQSISATVNRAKALDARQQARPPRVADNNVAPLAPPVLPLPPREAIPLNIQREMEQAIREAERQMAAAMPPPVRPFEPQEPEQPQLEPLPELAQPEQELPRLEFAPPDLAAVGPEIRGDELFQDIAPAGGWLVGYRAMKGESWGGSILALQPIYQVGAEYQLGQQCGGGVAAIEQRQFLAKPGYAVGKIEARIGLIMNAIRVEFRKVNGRQLDPTDAYFSEWFGGSGGGLQQMDGGDSPLVGLAGSYHPRDELIAIQALKLKPR